MHKLDVRLAGRQYKIDSQIDISEIKELGARKRGSSWYLPRLRMSLKLLIRMFGAKNLRFSKQVMADWKNPQPSISDEELQAAIPDLYPLLDSREGVRTPYQKETIRKMLGTHLLGTLLNVDPGLGKTFTTIAAAEAKFNMAGYRGSVLVIAPKSFLSSWSAELHKWGIKDDRIWHRSYPKPGFDVRGWNITNYQTIADFTNSFAPFRWDVVVVDESVNVKSRKSDRFDLLKQFRRPTQQWWLLSGAPITKFADDLWAQFKLLDPKAFTSYWRFAREYCIVEDNPMYPSKVIANKRAIDVTDEFQDLMITAKAHDVIDVVEPNYETIDVPMATEQAAMFKELKDTFTLTLSSGEELITGYVMSQMIKLQQIVSHPGNVDPGWEYGSAKLTRLLQGLHNSEIRLPAIIWTWWVETANILQKELAMYNALVANGKSKDSAGNIRAFQNGESDILILSLGVGKYGHTFKARSMVYYDKAWDFDSYVQSLERVTGGLRGLEVDEVPTVYTLHSPGTTDDLVNHNLTKKAGALHHVARNDLPRLLRSLK